MPEIRYSCTADLRFTAYGIMEADFIVSKEICFSVRTAMQQGEADVYLMDGFVLMGQFNQTLQLQRWPHESLVRYFEAEHHLNALSAAMKAYEFEAHVEQVKHLMTLAAEELAAEGQSKKFMVRWDDVGREVHSGFHL